ncbi:MAG: tetratricopeptide repeat protein [Candidatus Eisenbacteria bacterium]
MALGLGNFATAVQEYREALALRPDLFAAQNNLALLLLRAGRVDEARTHAMEAVKIDPTSVEACLTLGDVEIAGGDTLAAEMSWRHALDLRPTSAAARERLESLRRVIAQPGVSAP